MFLHGTLLALRLSPEDRKRINTCTVEEHRQVPRLQPLDRREFTLGDGQIFPGWYWKRLHNMVQYVADLTKPNGLVPQWGDQDSSRFVKFTPVLRCDDDKESWIEEPRDHRHLLALGGAVFGRQDWARIGERYRLDSQILASGIAPLPLEVPFPSEASNGELSGRGRDALEEASPGDEVRRLSSCGQESIWYPLGGSCILRCGTFWVGVRCERASQGGRGGHEHNDRLSFELNVEGRDIIVDWGTGVYTADPSLRNEFRSTANHSTVSVPGLEQNPWRSGIRGLFSLQENSNAEIIDLQADRFAGRHSGFGSVHERTILLDKHGLVIEDYLKGVRSSVSVLTLAPGVVPMLSTDGKRVVLRHGDLTLLVEPSPAGRSIQIVPGQTSESYGTFTQSHKVLVERISDSDSLRIRRTNGEGGEA